MIITATIIRLANMVLLFLFIFFIAKASSAPSTEKPKLLVVSYDAFRWDYLERPSTKYLQSLRDQGTSAHHMINAFVTKTFPNHHTISTGLYVEHHGVLDGHFYDKEHNKSYSYGPEIYSYNKSILPIWAVNEKAGQHTGVMMWPGSVFDYQGLKPAFIKVYNHSESVGGSWESRVDTLVDWFKDPVNPINFGMMYIDEPDFTGHGVGIDGPIFNKVLERLDNFTKYLHEKLASSGLENVNVIHVSDHGMATITRRDMVNLTNYINSMDYIRSGMNPVISIFPKEDAKANELYANLSKAAEETKKFDVYWKNDIPKRYHFSNNTRVGPILVVARVNYSFEIELDWYAKEFNFTIDDNSRFGIHGYDNSLSEMHPFFFAVGPDFSKNCEIEPFESINLFPLFCAVLQIDCPTVDGHMKFEDFKKCLPNNEMYYRTIYFGAIVLSLLGIIVLYLVHRRIKQRQDHAYRILSTEALLENRLLWEGRNIYEFDEQQYE